MSYPLFSGRGLIIGIDGRGLLTGAGSGRYTKELCKALDLLLPEARFVLFSNSLLEAPVASSRWSVVVDRSIVARVLPTFLWYLWRAGKLAEKIGVNRFWAPCNFLPLRLPKTIPTVLTVMDLVHRLHPETMSVRNRLASKIFFDISIAKASVICSISAGTAMRLRYFGYASPSKVVLPGVCDIFKRVSEDRVSTTRAAYGIPEKYILAASTLEPRKNLSCLVQAYINLVDSRELLETSLVLVGKNGWKCGSLKSQIRSALARNYSIICTGPISDEHLAALYSGTLVFVFPSVYEGFGLPVLEARSCGARVITSDTAELREAGGSEAIYCSPDIEGVQNALREVIHVPERPCFQEEAHNQLPKWEIEAEKLAKCFVELSDESPRSKDSLNNPPISRGLS